MTIATAREAILPSPRQPSLTTTHEKYLANGILKALRRGPTRSVQGITQRFQVIGVNSIPNGPPPFEHIRWYVARMPPHDGLGLPEMGILISDRTYQEAQTGCTQREWHDLHRIAHQTSIESLYYIREHYQTGWYAERNPLAGYAPGAATTIVSMAHLAGHVGDKSILRLVRLTLEHSGV